jgi:hypothetical protein
MRRLRLRRRWKDSRLSLSPRHREWRAPLLLLSSSPLQSLLLRSAVNAVRRLVARHFAALSARAWMRSRRKKVHSVYE